MSDLLFPTSFPLQQDWSYRDNFVLHRKAIRTTNLLERLFGEERRRLKVIPNAWGGKAVLKLMFVAMTRASGTWRPIGVTGFEWRQMEQIRSELDQEYEQANGPVQSPISETCPSILSSKIGTRPAGCFRAYPGSPQPDRR